MKKKKSVKKSVKNPVEPNEIEKSVIGLNRLASIVYSDAKAKGFHSSKVRIGDFVSNLHAEISELWEAYRNQTLTKPCDKKINLTCAEEELADVIIRSLDMLHAMKLNVENAVARKMLYNRTRPHRNGGKIA